MTSDNYLPTTGGGQLHVEHLRTSLIARGHSVVLVTNEPGVSTSDVTRIPWSKWSLVPLFREIYHEAKNADVVHAHYSYRCAALTGLAAWCARKPFIVTLHGLGTLDEAGARGVYKVAHYLYRYISLSCATAVISTSQDLADVAWHFVTRSKDKTMIIFNGIFAVSFDPSVCRGATRLNVPTIVTTRRLVPKNGIHFLVETMPYVIEKMPTVRYVMVGTGRMEQYIRDRIRDMHIEDHVEMVGDVANTDVPRYLCAADVVVFPSTAESSSLSCGEAMAMGKKIVSSRVGGLIELLGKESERGWLVDLVPWTSSNYDAPLTLDAERYASFAEVLVDALRDTSGVREKRAQDFARQELDWSIVAQKTETLYENTRRGN